MNMQQQQQCKKRRADEVDGEPERKGKFRHFLEPVVREAAPWLYRMTGLVEGISGSYGENAMFAVNIKGIGKQVYETPWIDETTIESFIEDAAKEIPKLVDTFHTGYGKADLLKKGNRGLEFLRIILFAKRLIDMHEEHGDSSVLAAPPKCVVEVVNRTLKDYIAKGMNFGEPCEEDEEEDELDDE